MYAIIMAGGSGTRLWPQSRKEKPKQFQPIYSENTLLQETAKRITPPVKNEKIYVVANASHFETVKQQLPQMPVENYIGEPIGRNTAPVVGIAAITIAHKDPNAIMLVTPADQIITDIDYFRKVLAVAKKIAKTPGSTVTIGINPTSPATGYGYIQMGEKVSDTDGVKVLKAITFKEKPDYQTATEYVCSGEYSWNSGIFVWSVKTILDLFKEHAPEIYSLLMEYDKAIGTQNEEKVFNDVYERFPAISVDHAILEHINNIFVIPADIGWSDLGSWPSLYEMVEADGNGNVIKGKHIGIDTKNCLISSSGDRLITTIGIENMIIVDTKDTVMILPMSHAQEIKNLLEILKEKDMGKYL